MGCGYKHTGGLPNRGQDKGGAQNKHRKHMSHVNKDWALEKSDLNKEGHGRGVGNRTKSDKKEQE